MTLADSTAGKRMRLRYAGTCRRCGGAVAAGEQAVYYREAKQVECVTCAELVAPKDTGAITDPVPSAVIETAEPAPGEELEAHPDAGTAGASARRVHERLVAKREARVRAAHPRLGGLFLAVTDEPQSTTAWATGARGEELLAKRLDKLTEQGVLLLHDRRIPGSVANIDHIAVSAGGAFVIDAKRYKGRPHLRVEGGILRPRTEKLIVGTRDCTKLVEGVTKQVGLVTDALARAGHDEVPVHGMLCFEADWPLIGGSFSIGGVAVLWPKKANEVIAGGVGLEADMVAAVHKVLGTCFPIA